MATDGLSLLGFMDQQSAVSYLQNRCIPDDPSPDALARHWDQARERLGIRIPNAGSPEILDIPPEHQDYLQGVAQNPRFASTVHGMNWSFKMVEVDPILAFQFHVETPRSADLCHSRNAHNLEELLRVCLPHDLETIPYQIHGQPNSVLFKAKSSNFRLMTAGFLGVDGQHLSVAGIQFGSSSPLVQVCRFEGKCYLRNGFHRTYGLRIGGASHVPCLLLEATDFAQIGARGGGATFDRDLLEGPNPPTCGHFVQGRAYPIRLRTVTRIIQITWSDYSILDED